MDKRDTRMTRATSSQPTTVTSGASPFAAGRMPVPDVYQTPTAEQEQDLADAITLLQSTGMPAFTSPNSTIVSTVRMVPVKELWINPIMREAMAYGPGDIANLSASVRATQAETGDHGILEPIVATPMADPRRHSAREGKSLLVISGFRRVLVADQTGQDYVPIIVRTFPSFEAALRASVKLKVSPQSPDPLQTGLMIKALRAARDYEIARRLQAGEPAIQQMTQEQIADELACDRSWVSVCERIPDQPAEIIEYVRAGLIPPDRIKDLLVIDDEGQQLALARAWVRMAELGQPVGREMARAQVAEVAAASRTRSAAGSQRPPRPWQTWGMPSVTRTPSHRLGLSGYHDQAPVALGTLLADAHVLTEEIVAGFAADHKKVPAELQQLLALLDKPAMATFVSQMSRVAQGELPFETLALEE